MVKGMGIVGSSNSALGKKNNFSKRWFIIASILFIFFISNSSTYAIYLGVGAQYSYSYLNYKIVEDDFYNLDEYEHADAKAELSAVGIREGGKTKSIDYGLCFIIDNADNFEQLGNVQLKLEYYQFSIPFDRANNTITGIRYGFSILFGYDVIGNDDYKISIGFNTGLYKSTGTSSINESEYLTVEMPLGLTIGNKISLSDNSALMILGTYNFYNFFVNNNSFFLAGYNFANNSLLNFAARRNEFVINCSYVYQFGTIWF